jgi:dihydroorotase
MLVDDPRVLERLFAEAPTLIAAHCEHEPTIRRNREAAKEKYGDDVPVEEHPRIRSEEACYLSSEFAVGLAKRKGARLHVLHLTTARELALFDSAPSLKEKKITCEVCVHHLRFDDSGYPAKGSLIKWNPAIKTAKDREGLLKALIEGTIDVVATDHAPHTLEEKRRLYFDCPSGGPLVQHSLPVMMEFFHDGILPLEKIVEKMCHHPAILFSIDRRGYLREGYFADIVVIDPSRPWTVDSSNILYKCGWSPFLGERFRSMIWHTLVSGTWIVAEGRLQPFRPGMRLAFSR